MKTGCWRVVFAGRVQGVGFRYHVFQTVSPFAVTGFVRNQTDGTVELVVQGDPDILKNVVDLIQSRPPGQIDRHQIDPNWDSPEVFTAFEIRR